MNLLKGNIRITLNIFSEFYTLFRNLTVCMKYQGQSNQYYLLIFHITEIFNSIILHLTLSSSVKGNNISRNIMLFSKKTKQAIFFKFTSWAILFPKQRTLNMIIHRKRIFFSKWTRQFFPRKQNK